MTEKKPKPFIRRIFGDDLCRLAVVLAIAGLFPHAVEALSGLAKSLQGVFQGTAQAHSAVVSEKAQP